MLVREVGHQRIVPLLHLPRPFYALECGYVFGLECNNYIEKFLYQDALAKAARTESSVCTRGGLKKIQRRMRAAWGIPYQGIVADPGI